jgi:hypothetical protein
LCWIACHADIFVGQNSASTVHVPIACAQPTNADKPVGCGQQVSSYQTALIAAPGAQPRKLFEVSLLPDTI